jgi:hypothetical protein
MSNRLLQFLPVAAVVGGMAMYSLYKEGFFGSARPTATTSRASGGVDLPAADRALNDKLQPFIACINRVDANLLKSIDLYREHFRDLATRNGQPLKDGTLRIQFDTFRGFKIEVYETDNSLSKDCTAGLEKAAALQPKDAELDRIAATYATTLKGLIAPMNEADIYYSQKDHVDDRLAKGRKLDAQMAPLFATLEKTSSEMRAAVTERDGRLKEARLGAIEKQRGKTLEWHTLNVMIEARKAVATINAPGTTPTRDVITAAEQRLQLAFDAARASAAAAPQPQGNAPRSPWTRIESNVANVLGAIKDLRRDVEAGKNPREVEQARGRVTNQYNSLVRNSNLLGGF